MNTRTLLRDSISHVHILNILPPLLQEAADRYTCVLFSPNPQVPDTVPGTWGARQKAVCRSTSASGASLSTSPWQAGRDQSLLSHPGGLGKTTSLQLYCSAVSSTPKSITMKASAVCPGKIPPQEAWRRHGAHRELPMAPGMAAIE